MFFLTLTEPLTILPFAAIFASLGLGGSAPDYLSSAVLFAGSTLWWFVLSAGVSLLRGRFTDKGMMWINRISGVAIVAFGVLTLYDVFV